MSLVENKSSLSPTGSEQKKPLGWVVIFVVGALIISAVSAYLYFTQNQNKPTDIKPPQGDQTEVSGKELFAFSLTRPAFADASESFDLVKPQVPKIRTVFSKITNAKSFAEKENINFSASQIQALEDNGFFLTENEYIKDQTEWEKKDDFVDSYKKIMGSTVPFAREPQNTVFITSDLALHLYHILIDRSFQRIEETKFQPMLRAMTTVLFKDALNNYNTATTPELKETYKRLTAYYLVPLVALDTGTASAGVEINPDGYKTFAEYLAEISEAEIANSEKPFSFSLSDKTYNGQNLPDEIFNLASEEMKLVNEAKGIALSPLFTTVRPEFKNDYSQFTPRSHYTKNDVLKSYFIAMMWYGRMGFTLNSPELTRDALVITGQINSLSTADEKIAKLWSDMAVAIDFFVGEEDDLNAFQYTEEAKKIFGDNLTDSELTNSDRIDDFIEAAKKDLPKPRILSEAIMMSDVDEKSKEALLADTMQFRFFGQRFTIDAYILNKLTQGDESPDPETGQKLPTMPTALMPISLIAPENKMVKGYLDAWVTDPMRIEKQGRESDKVIAKIYAELDKEIKSYDESVWTQNIYWSWLHCLQPLLASYGEGYPVFMANEAWQKKNLGTTLGSYTELKHDTLLYAKQSYAELGGGGPEGELPPAVKGYVEPDIVFWNRIISLAKKTKSGLESRGLMPEYFRQRYDIFIEQAEFYRQIAIKELKNEKISDDDFEKLRVSPFQSDQIVMPLPGQELTDKDKRAGIIADIHTDAVKSEILYEATGKPHIIYVAIQDANGSRLTRGAVFNHYEFAEKIDGRLTDEKWQEKVYSGKGDLPVADTWTASLLVK